MSGREESLFAAGRFKSRQFINNLRVEDLVHLPDRWAFVYGNVSVSFKEIMLRNRLTDPIKDANDIKQFTIMIPNWTDPPYNCSIRRWLLSHFILLELSILV